MRPCFPTTCAYTDGLDKLCSRSCAAKEQKKIVVAALESIVCAVDERYVRGRGLCVERFVL